MIAIQAKNKEAVQHEVSEIKTTKASCPYERLRPMNHFDDGHHVSQNVAAEVGVEAGTSIVTTVGNERGTGLINVVQTCSIVHFELQAKTPRIIESKRMSMSRLRSPTIAKEAISTEEVLTASM